MTSTRCLVDAYLGVNILICDSKDNIWPTDASGIRFTTHLAVLHEGLEAKLLFARHKGARSPISPVKRPGAEAHFLRGLYSVA